MNLDPMLSLAVTVQSNPGAYALLLGSGTSRSAQIPTGWDVTLDLVRRVAAAAKTDAGADPEKWYLERFGKPPRYSDLLKEVARSQAQRARLLRGYFEPTDDEREQGMKLPMPGHHAIARLVAGGYVKLVLETNFDRLVETAIQETAGIVPTVISSVDALKGSPPLVHSQCTVVKLHGDYLDTRILNTDEELSKYPPELDAYLDRLLDEFGLVVVGWSGEWDRALRAALERRKSRRYGMYWASRSEPIELAARLIKLQGADRIVIKDADTFLSDVADRVQAVADTQRRPALAAATAVAMVKRYLVDDSNRIRLHDLLGAEVDRTLELVGGEQLSMVGMTITSDVVTNRVDRADAASEVLRGVLACGCYWSAAYNDLWVRALQRLVNPGTSPVILNSGFDTRFLPALFAYYAAGIGAVAAGNYGVLRAIFLDTKIVEYDKETPLVVWLHPVVVLGRDLAKFLPGLEQRKTPLNDYLQVALRESLKPIVPSEREYQEAFDRFEYLLALVYADQKPKSGWAPVGCFGWRETGSIVAKIEREIKEQGVSWAPMILFGPGFERLEAARAVVAEIARHYRFM